MFTFSEMLALVQSESSFGAFVFHRRPAGLQATSDLVPDEQFGFLQKRSTVWQLLSVLEDIDSALDERKEVHACFFRYLEGI